MIEKEGIQKTLEKNFFGTDFTIHIVGGECILYWNAGPSEEEVRDCLKPIVKDFNISCHRKEKREEK